MLGQRAGAQQAQATSLLYSGEQFDPTLQQYHLRARDYNPANGQFTSLDPYSGNPHDPQSLHKYAYCHADPVNGVDPSGEMTLTNLCVAMTTSSMVIGGIIGARLQADGYLARVRNSLCGVVVGYFVGTLLSLAASSVVVVGYLGWGVFSGSSFLEANLILAYGTAFYAGASQNSWILRQIDAGLKMVSRVFQKSSINITVIDQNAGESARFRYDSSSGRYRDVTTGRFISQRGLPWPGNRGFAGTPVDTTLGKGTIIDRYGKLSGQYAGSPGASVSARGMAPGSEGMFYTRLEVVRPITVPSGPAAAVPDFAATGGAIQYFFAGGLQKWIDAGYLKVVP